MSGPSAVPEPNLDPLAQSQPPVADPAAVNAALEKIAQDENASAQKIEHTLALEKEITTFGGFAARMTLSAVGAAVPLVPSLAPFAPMIAVALAAGGEAIDASLAQQQVVIPAPAVQQLADLASQKAKDATAAGLAKLLGGTPAGDAAAQAAAPAIADLASKEAGAAVQAVADEIQKQV